MKKKTFVRLFLTFFFIISLTFFYLKLTKKTNIPISNFENNNEVLKNSNISLDIKYISYDEKGNKYTINAEKGEVDLKNANEIYLTNIKALIELSNSEKIKITSDFGKYNILNYNTIFSKNVRVNYLENNIASEYLDFSLEKNSMIISRDVVYSSLENILYADVVEINIKNKDTKIFMDDSNQKVKIYSK